MSRVEWLFSLHVVNFLFTLLEGKIDGCQQQRTQTSVSAETQLFHSQAELLPQQVESMFERDLGNFSIAVRDSPLRTGLQCGVWRFFSLNCGIGKGLQCTNA